jgi:polygalacturonase
MSNVRDFGAKGDGQTDDTAALNHAFQKGDGQVVLPRGDYRLTRPLRLALSQVGRLSLDGQGGARLLMSGPGPALHLVGSHQKTAQPDHVAETVWLKERMPTVRGLEIVGQHPEADGLRLEGLMQPILEGLLVRRCRHAVHCVQRLRNVIITDCHLYDNSGVGVFLDHVNLHQVNIHGNHISYCKQGGIRVVDSEVRNIQICGNDIEYNCDLKAARSADVEFDCRQRTVREGTIVGNTIQAVKSPGGANVRLVGVGKENRLAVGLLAITGNLIGSQETLLHLAACRGVVVNGNALYNGYHNAIWAEDAEHLVVGANSIDHNPQYPGASTDRVLLRGCRHVSLTGLLLQHTRGADQDVAASVEVLDCENVNVTGCQVLNARGHGVLVQGSSVVRIADCTLRGRENEPGYRSAVRVDQTSARVMVVNNFLGKGRDGALELPAAAGTAAGNLVL